MHKNAKGFTFVELIVATVILGIAVAGVYAAFLSSAKFTGAFRHEVMAVIGGQSLADQARAEYEHTDPDSATPPYAVDDAVHGIHGTSPDISSWRLNTEVDNLTAGYSVSDEDLSGGTHPYGFKRVTVTVNWDEREI